MNSSTQLQDKDTVTRSKAVDKLPAKGLLKLTEMTRSWVLLKSVLFKSVCQISALAHIELN